LPHTTIKRSTFYYQTHRREAEDNQELLQIIKDIKQQHPGYGYRPVTDKLHRRGIEVNHKRVSRLMREHGLSSQMYNRQTRKYDSSIGPQGKKVKNRLHRRFQTDRPYQKMVTYVSEYRYGNRSQDERVYLSPIKDLCSGEIVSYNIGDHPTTDFVMKPLIELINKRPKLSYRMTVHSDQGIQYQTNMWRQALKKHHIFQSMSRRATCLDNAPMESFFHTMKTELYYGHHYQTRQELIKAMKEWIKYYNQERIKHKLKGKPPIEYRNLALEKVA
jgi:transposase InsO family protein